jgi:hypothetical protein
MSAFEATHHVKVFVVRQPLFRGISTVRFAQRISPNEFNPWLARWEIEGDALSSDRSMGITSL